MLGTAHATLWELQARQWALLKPPLRPAPEDVAVAQAFVDTWHATHRRAPRALVLGSTVELAALRWPSGSEIIAVDRSSTMLQGVWRQAPLTSGHRRAAVGEWLQMPLRDGCCDLVLGDGSFASVRKAEARGLARAVHRLLGRDGAMLTRMFVRPAVPESPAAVWSDLLSGAIGGFSAFKLRLLMALQDGDHETRVQDAWRFVHGRAPSLEWIAHRTGWPIDEVRTIESYCDQPTVYWFPQLEQFRAALEESFVERDCRHQAYEVGDRCPTLQFAPRT